MFLTIKQSSIFFYKTETSKKKHDDEHTQKYILSIQNQVYPTAKFKCTQKLFMVYTVHAQNQCTNSYILRFDNLYAL